MKTKIKYLDGVRFKRSIIASARRVCLAENHLNEINVFPVPDGDTGTNMAVTMNSIALAAEECQQTSFEGISNAIADSALSGARGNSGAILAQFFQGLAEATAGKVRLTTQAFSSAAKTAAERAKNAISNPIEGTIITVMRDWANSLVEHAPNTYDFIELFKKSLTKAKESLADTPNKLKVLKKAGVVDAGAEGFVNLLEGIVDFIEAGKVAALKVSSHVAGKIRSLHLDKVDSDIPFQYCSECLIEGSDIDKESLRQRLSAHGDSVIVIGSKIKARVHIHTNNPQEVFNLSSQYGVVVKTKVDDMHRQHYKAMADTSLKGIALVTDSTCDLPPEIIDKYNIHVAPIMVQVSEKSFLDKVEIKPKDFYLILQKSNQKLSTSQPPLAAFKKVYDKTAEEYESIISIHISEKLSGTIQAAHTACKGTWYQKKINVIDGKTTSAALGLLVAEAGRLIEKGLEIGTIVERLRTAANHVKIFVSIPSLKYLVRSGRLTRTKGIIGALLNLKPVITINPEGRIEEAAKVIGHKKVVRKTLELAVEFAKSVKNPRFGVAHVLASGRAQWYRDQIRSCFSGAEIMIMEASPALGVHVGIGGAAIAVLGDS